ncbi:MAG: DUF86 domain-containing protein [Candidatus Nanoarchaeia archaeon]|nr:DUF86 domain-containing protein [Candidatus Nanoarchaeia archaeon]
MNRIKDKIGDIENYLEELENIIPKDLEEYQKNIEKKAACERYFEKIVEAIVDLAQLVIKFKKFSYPDEDTQAFEILLQNKIIQKDLCEKLKDAKGMRNILAHEYGNVDDELVFEAITQEIIIDSEEFIESIKKRVL